MMKIEIFTTRRYLESRMRVSLDSNAWETIFNLGDTDNAPIRAAIKNGKIAGFICEAGFRIEAITKQNRRSYFARPHMEVRMDTTLIGKVFQIAVSIGPDNAKHPGLPAAQAEKLQLALAAGVKLMPGQNWLGLPVPQEIRDRSHFVEKDTNAYQKREQRQVNAYAAIEERGVGKAIFDAVDGWTDRPRTPAEERQLIRACAEWADGELVAAHIAYQNDILCTNDLAKAAGRSVF